MSTNDNDTAGRGKPSGERDRAGQGRGRGRGRGRYGGRCGGRSRSNSTNRAPKFKGNTDGMNGHVFQSHNENASKNQFLKTVEALSEYINKNLEPKDMSTR